MSADRVKRLLGGGVQDKGGLGERVRRVLHAFINMEC